MKRILYAVPVVLLLFLCFWFTTGKSRLNVDLDRRAQVSKLAVAADSTAVATDNIATDNEYQQTKDNAGNQKPLGGKTIPAVANPDWDKKIIKTAELHLEVKSFAAFIHRLREAVRNSGGYIAQEEQSQSNYEISNTVTIKVPVARFEELLAQLPSDSDRLEDKKITSQDVTGEVVDTKSRLETKKEVRERYLELLRQAHSMKDILAVQGEINGIQEEMDQAAGRITWLSHSAAYSTINMKFYQVLNPGAPKDSSPSFVQRLKDAITDGWQGLSDFLIGLLHVWPLLIFIAFVAWYIRRTIRSVRPLKVLAVQPKAEPAK